MTFQHCLKVFCFVFYCLQRQYNKRKEVFNVDFRWDISASIWAVLWHCPEVPVAHIRGHLLLRPGRQLGHRLLLRRTPRWVEGQRGRQDHPARRRKSFKRKGLTKSNGTLYNRTFWLLPLHWGKLLVRRGSRVWGVLP